jgi:hypothetical protein
MIDDAFKYVYNVIEILLSPAHQRDKMNVQAGMIQQS